MRRRGVCCVLLVLVTAACADPPSKEMSQAQGAIDAARAAGAERYAPEEYKAAVDALTRSQDAVNQRDYRLALNHALDSRERAQTAARTAADQKAVVRSEAERLLTQTALAIVQANTRLKQVEAVKGLRRSTAVARAKIDAAENGVQEARAALDGGDYLDARDTLRAASADARTALRELDGLATPAAVPKRKT